MDTSLNSTVDKLLEDVQQNPLLVLIGKNGAGKTTLLKHLAERLEPEGCVYFREDMISPFMAIIDTHVAELVRDDLEWLLPDVKPPYSLAVARLAAMLNALHVPVHKYIIVEYPDFGINPGSFPSLIDLFRSYHHDFGVRILCTTHNPRFLDAFALEEVRIVQRTAEDITVSPIPAHIREIWLNDHTLGEVWMTNSFEALNMWGE